MNLEELVKELTIFYLADILRHSCSILTAQRIGKEAYQLELLEEAGVATIAGTSFGRFGEGYLRLSYANSLENIRLALERIGTHLDARQTGAA